jgi:hypothetical protein
VDPGREQIAEVAVELLLERINEKGTKVPPRQILADYRVVARESTGFVDPEPAHASAVSPSVLADQAGGKTE